MKFKTTLLSIALAALLAFGATACVTSRVAPLNAPIEMVQKAEWKIIAIKGNDGTTTYNIIVPSNMPDFLNTPYIAGPGMPLSDISYMVNFMDGDKRYTVLVLLYPDGERIVAYFDAQKKDFWAIKEVDAIPVKMTEEEAGDWLADEDAKIRGMEVS